MVPFCHSKKQWQEAAVEVAPACITMEQVVTMTATATVMGNVRSNNQLMATVDMLSLTIGFFLHHRLLGDLTGHL